MLNTLESNEEYVLGTAVLQSGKFLGLSQSLVGKIIGRSHITIAQAGIDPSSKSGEMALLLVRVYRSLYAILGGHKDEMKVWMSSPNAHLNHQIPRDLVLTVSGLVSVVAYLDAMRGRA
ncbi:MbcA/ParS/Xre antitoxin family protein [Porticoccaceae bacterium]|mgnify:CR=1 FL=1|jgi:hypothetical protein|nr:MbcA/ParS/Xre antitoxin family protein [Porticoccaceae bacterium]MDA8652368.1 MbcA/ParS/Xre antitoxin family protein [Porticoccaceae bacterium]MDA8663477.1 MbcA/ParS/Xre antitoxin family protein [Porticoccaceae bacterium]MDA8788833.1 MbcA/ParS/Xre antitoxin family protein [Porticoccaceae bacterium]MDB2343167.1 MbcA/ParS/Xre antitoxin family protein [Porticoccaceae bacterium]